jgi:hypothetical protein
MTHGRMTITPLQHLQTDDVECPQIHHLQRDDVLDSIIQKLTVNGAYSCSSAYTTQFTETILSCMDFIVWKAWAPPPPPKCKLFSWLIVENCVWTADCLEKRDDPMEEFAALRTFKHVSTNAYHHFRYIGSSWKLGLGLLLTLGIWVFSLRESKPYFVLGVVVRLKLGSQTSSSLLIN